MSIKVSKNVCMSNFLALVRVNLIIYKTTGNYKKTYYKTTGHVSVCCTH